MNMDFKSAKELLELCEQTQLPISEVMRQRECILGETPRDAVDHRMGKAWEIMRSSATQPLKKPIKSMGGLIGGEARKLEAHYNKKKSICGDVLEKAMTYAMAVLEVNASMGLIVAAPTAGSAQRHRGRCRGRLSGRDRHCVRHGSLCGSGADGRHAGTVSGRCFHCADEHAGSRV